MISPHSDRFFTPPKVPKVDIRVASLRGGGACPSQYWGQTLDGREVYIRYRGGYLSIDAANNPNEEARRQGDLLGIQLGPPLDGELSAKQLINLTGLQVDELDETQVSAETDSERDLSGATTFWNAREISATNEGALEFLSALWREFPECQIFEISWSQQRVRNKRLLKPGELPKETVLEIFLGQDCPAIRLQFGRFKYDFPGYGRPDADARYSDEVARKIETVGTFGCAVKYDSLSVSSEFSTSDVTARDWLQRLDPKLDACFPQTDYLPHDLASGKVLDDELLKAQDCTVISEWVRASSNRFRYVRRKARDAPLIGYR